MSDWLDFRSIATGLAIAAIIGLAGWLRSRWKRRQRLAAERQVERIPLRVGAEAVARELRVCADVVEPNERQQAYLYEIAARIPTIEWPQRNRDMAALREEDGQLWDELDEAYDALRRTKNDRHSKPPSAASLRSIAARLEKLAR